ncbi:MAG: hypothetical protein JST05_01105 [Acidobacteria bacterium]|nr:hypothetical protein [Acidobacteriota bacterium]
MRFPAWAWKGLGLALALAGAFLAGRWSIPRGKPLPLVVGPSAPLHERDLSPAPEVRTVIVTRTVPGKPLPPPVPAQADLGQHLQTTSTALPALPQGATLHDALFGQVDGNRLTLRSVEWADGPQGRVPLGPADTVTANVTLHLPAPSAPPHWGVSALVGLEDGRRVYGGELEAWKGPFGAQLGTIGSVTFAGIGVRW